MKRIFLAVFAAFIGFSLPIHDAEAKRLGGGKSFGMQRDSVTKREAAPPQRNADQQQNASGAPQQNAAGAAASPAGNRSWLGPVAGIAAGLGLAALASHLGLGEEFANILLIALLAMGGFLLYRFLTRNRHAAQPAGGMQYAGMGAGGNLAGGNISPLPASGEPMRVTGAAPAAAALPPGFDAEGFARQAKLNFIRLQAAYDAGNLDDIRDFTTPEVFAELRMQLGERGDAEQRTDVVNLDAEVLECAEEPGRLVVSVRFHGLIREELGGEARDFDEVWHLAKPASGKGGWLVAGIQQAD